MFYTEYLIFHLIFHQIYNRAWLLHVSYLCHKSCIENKGNKFNNGQSALTKLHKVYMMFIGIRWCRRNGTSPGCSKMIAHKHEILPDVSAIAEQFIFLMRTIGTSPACFLLLTLLYRQENRIRRTVQACNKSQTARRNTSNGDLFHGNLLDSRAYGRVVPVIAVKLGPPRLTFHSITASSSSHPRVCAPG